MDEEDIKHQAANLEVSEDNTSAIKAYLALYEAEYQRLYDMFRMLGSVDQVGSLLTSTGDSITKVESKLSHETPQVFPDLSDDLSELKSNLSELKDALTETKHEVEAHSKFLSDNPDKHISLIKLQFEHLDEKHESFKKDINEKINSFKDDIKAIYKYTLLTLSVTVVIHLFIKYLL